jgi:benzoyl-CoA reductase/2-hydroxyglutaryl-CoA dehydratase subunit BcrC/BadD/HgdB
VPVEVLYAAGLTPCDVNNVFITSDDPVSLVRYAKMHGFPDTTCSWICGLYGAIMKMGIRRVVAVEGGDCAETLALMEVLTLKGVEIIPFAYPHRRDRELLRAELASFSKRLGTDLEKAEAVRIRLDAVRARIHHLDSLLWREDRAYGDEVQLIQLSSSDFEGDPDAFSVKVENKIRETEARSPIATTLRIGFLGVPPIIADLYSQIEKDGVRIVYSEVQRQFSLPAGGSLVDSYHAYTYPYGIYARCEDIEREVKLRRIDGVIHYVQAFCFRGIEDIVLRERLAVPVLTLQGDLPSRVTETMRIRIEAFIDMLLRKKGV